MEVETVMDIQWKGGYAGRPLSHSRDCFRICTRTERPPALKLRNVHTEIRELGPIIWLVQYLDADNVGHVLKLINQEHVDLDCLVRVRSTVKQSRLTIGYTRVGLAVLTACRPVNVEQDTDAGLRGHVDRANNARPRVDINTRIRFERRARDKGWTERPVSDWEADGIDANASKVVKICLVNERIPVSLENGAGTIGGYPTRGDVYFGAPWF